MMTLRKTLTVDPGMHTGWAYWNEHNTPELTDLFYFKPERGRVTKLYMQLSSLWQHFAAVLKVCEPDEVIIENNALWWGNAKSVVAEQSGALHTLTLLTGGYCLQCENYNARWSLVQPQKWKGQLTDDALKAQIKILINREYRHHEQEAVGIGLWKMGKL
jgi:hypothetical protein